jgi:hypothetical protein
VAGRSRVIGLSLPLLILFWPVGLAVVIVSVFMALYIGVKAVTGPSGKDRADG